MASQIDPTIYDRKGPDGHERPWMRTPTQGSEAGANSAQSNAEAAESEINGLDTRVTALENNGGGGAPVDAAYITQTPNAELANEQALSTLTTGLMKNTTTTGVIVIAAEGTDYYAPGGTDVALADGGTGASDAGSARTNLGSGANGDDIFTGVTAAANRTTLGSGAVGDNLFTSATAAQAQQAMDTEVGVDVAAPKGVNAARESFIAAASNETTPLTTGTKKVTFRMPYAFTLEEVRASLTAAQASGTIFTADVNEAGVSILSTKITIDNTEKTSVTAAIPPVISDTALANDAEITVDIDQIGDGTAAGLKVTLIGYKT